MSEPDKKILCSSHGEQVATFVCQHLLKGFGNGFYAGYSEEFPDDPFPDAWCKRCDEMLETCGEWNDESEAFADIKLICSSCYLAIKLRNQDEKERRRFAFGELEDVEENHKANPRTFSLPRKEERESLVPGQIVKLHFCLHAPEQGAPHAERMWVELLERKNGKYKGILNNEPYFIADLTENSEIEFESRHISAIYVEADARAHIREDLLASVDKAVSKDDNWPLFACRKPERVSDLHSGWIILSSRQTEPFIQDLEEMPLSQVFDLFPILDSIAGEEAGSSWLWNEEDLEYKRV